MRPDWKQSGVPEHHRARPDPPERLSTYRVGDYQIRQKQPKPASAFLRLASCRSSGAQCTPYSLRPELKQRARKALRRKWKNIACRLQVFLLELGNIAMAQWMISDFGFRIAECETCLDAPPANVLAGPALQFL